jgi:hypothetical protein
LGHNQNFLFMKLYTKGALLLLAGMALSYSACKKDSSTAPKTQITTTTTVTTTASYNTVSSQVASNFVQTLAGSMGGANLNDGLAPSFAAKFPPGASALCGFVADTTIDFKTNIGDTIKTHVTGKSKFFFDCVGGQPVGYTLVDALLTVGTAPGYAFTFDLAQGYQITSLNKKATLLDVDGSLRAFKDIVYTNKAFRPLSEHDSFVITNAVVDISAKGKIKINGGSATFTTKGTNPDGTKWDLVGKMEFIGHNIGKLTFNGSVFYVDLSTGKITTI